MAPINQSNNTDIHKEYFNILNSWLATISMLVSLIVSLVGIKIWWFKHRLTFDQTGTHNGAAGGSQPILRNNAKDKRASQQICDSVVVHGVFRKRQEDELDVIDRPKQLPPVRIPERSQSTSALLAPPRSKRGQQSNQNLPPLMLSPPTREPPKPPTISINETEDLTISKTSTPTPIIGERTFMALEEGQKVEQPIEDAVEVEHATTPTVKLFENEENFSPNFTENLNKEQRAETTKNENDSPYVIELVEPSPQPSHTNEEFKNFSNINGKTQSSFQEEEEAEENAFNADNLFNLSGFDVKDYGAENNEPHGTWNDVDLKTSELPKFDSKSETTIPKNESINFAIELEEFERKHNQIWENLETKIVEQNFKHNFYNNDDNDDDNNDNNFAKRRHSYQEHEGHFLELRETELSPVETKPLGFGKSIDEDWESFQNLRTTKKSSEENWQETFTTTTTTTNEILEAQTNYNHLHHHHHFEEEHSNRQISTSYIQSIEELYDELGENSDTEPEIIVKETISSPPKTSILKERLQDFKAATNETPTARTRKIKPQQKVTFDFNTEEHYLPEESDSEYSDNEGNNLPPTPMQRTTKTAFMLEERDREPRAEQQRAALLFSTQISLEDSEANGGNDEHRDSWSAIRQRRYQNETFGEAYETPPQPALRNAKAYVDDKCEQFQVPAPRKNMKKQRQLSFEDYHQNNSVA